MSYHIVSVDSPTCSLSCKDGQLTCKTESCTNSIPIEDVAAIIITSFSATIHSSLIIEAAKHGVGMVICETFKPASIILPANRATDTILTRAQVDLGTPARERLWQRTVNAKTLNQWQLACTIAPDDSRIEKLELIARGRHPHKESECARLYWQIYSDALALNKPFRRGRNEGAINPLLNYGYAVLLSIVLQKLFALGLDPTFGIFHATRAHATPLAYDLMEPFRPCVDLYVATWIKDHPSEADWNVTPEFRRHISAVSILEVEYSNSKLEFRGVIEDVMRSFRMALKKNKTTLYKPWTPPNSRWAGSW